MTPKRKIRLDAADAPTVSELVRAAEKTLADQHDEAARYIASHLSEMGAAIESIQTTDDVEGKLASVLCNASSLLGISGLMGDDRLGAVLLSTVRFIDDLREIPEALSAHRRLIGSALVSHLQYCAAALHAQDQPDGVEASDVLVALTDLRIFALDKITADAGSDAGA